MTIFTKYFVYSALAMAALGGSVAEAQQQRLPSESITVPGEECVLPQLVNAFQMIRDSKSNTDTVPLAMGGKQMNFLLATGSYTTMIKRSAAESANLQIRRSADIRALNGDGIEFSEAVVPGFTLGAIDSGATVFHLSPQTEVSEGAYLLDIVHMPGPPTYMAQDSPFSMAEQPSSFMGHPVSTLPVGFDDNGNLVTQNTVDDAQFNFSRAAYQTAVNASSFDGFFGLDYINAYDSDIDFSNDIYQMFDRDHCPGKTGAAWGDAEVSVMPLLTLNENYSLRVPVMLDGKQVNALIDTSSSVTKLRVDVARYEFGLTGDSGSAVPEGTFHSLTFGGVAVANPRIVFMSNTTGFHQTDVEIPTGSLIADRNKVVSVPELVIGMNVLRKLHIYIAPKEGDLYVALARTAQTN